MPFYTRKMSINYWQKKLKVRKRLTHGFFCQKFKKKLNCFFWGILGVDKVFGDILNSTQSTLEEKNVHICEWPKNWSFSNGSIQGFCQKMDILKQV